MEVQRDDFSKDHVALVIIDNFKGQIRRVINALLEYNNIQVCLLPPNTTAVLQPSIDVAVNKLAKDFKKRIFEDWYANEISNRLNRNS